MNFAIKILAACLMLCSKPLRAYHLGLPIGEGGLEDYQTHKRSWLLVPGIYADLDKAVGFELSFISNYFGLVYGQQSRGVKYLEAEVFIFFLSFGVGQRWGNYRDSLQMTLSLPIYFLFPYWRWHHDWPEEDAQKTEFGIMLKFPIPIGDPPKALKHPEPKDII